MLALFLGLCSTLLLGNTASGDITQLFNVEGGSACVSGQNLTASSCRGDVEVRGPPSAARHSLPRGQEDAAWHRNTTDVHHRRRSSSSDYVSRSTSSPPPPTSDEEEVACQYPVTVLDFLHDWSNSSRLEEKWPCEVRVYWVEQLYPLVTLVRSLLSYCAPVIVVLGVTVNSMAFAVLSTSALSSSSLSVYLRALAVTDNCALVFNVAISFALAHVPGLAGLFKTHEWLCALNKVLLGMSFYYSTWLVVSLTWERLATITYPLTLGVWCSKKVAMVVVCTFGVLSLMVGVVRVKYSGFEQDSVFEFEPCSVHTGLSLTPALYGYISLSMWLPLVLIVVGNLCLVATLRRSARTRSALTAKKDRDTLRLTRMLLIVSVAYMVLLLPLGVVATLELFWNIAAKQSSLHQGSTLYSHWLKEKLLLKWVRGLFYFIYLFNFCINFFLYCMSGKTFRRAVAHHFRRRLSQPLGRLYKSSPLSSLQGDSPRKPSAVHANGACLADNPVPVDAERPDVSPSLHCDSARQPPFTYINNAYLEDEPTCVGAEIQPTFKVRNDYIPCQETAPTRDQPHSTAPSSRVQLPLEQPTV